MCGRQPSSPPVLHLRGCDIHAAVRMLVRGGRVPLAWASVLGSFTREFGTVMGGLFPLPPEGLDEEWRTNPAWKRWTR